MNEFPGREHAKGDVDSGVYEVHYQIKPGDTIIDLGANVGYFTELASNKVGNLGRVYAFEPSNDNFDELFKLVGDRNNVVLERAAAFIQDCARMLRINKLNCGGHSLLEIGDMYSHSEICRCVDIGRYINDGGIKPDFIKIDTEGSELWILKSLYKHGIKTPMAIECHSHELYEACKNETEAVGMKWVCDGCEVGVHYSAI